MGHRPATVLCLSSMFVATLLISSPEASAKSAEIPPVVSSGLSAYEKDGPEAAFKAWLAGSPLEGDKTALSQANVFRQVESLYGKYQGFDLIKTTTLTPKTVLIYLQIDLQKGPLFASFVCYQEKDGWIITMLNFHTEVEKIVPPEILYAG